MHISAQRQDTCSLMQLRIEGLLGALFGDGVLKDRNACKLIQLRVEGLLDALHVCVCVCVKYRSRS